MEQVIHLANNTKAGLAAYIYTKDINKLNIMIEQLKYGMIGANHFSVSAANCPFGGIKELGLGREGGEEGLLEFLQLKKQYI